MTRKSMIWICAALLAAGAGFMATDSASAGWGSFGQRSGYGNHGHWNSGRSGYGYGHNNHGSNFRRGYDYGHGSYNRGRSHYDYHAPSIRWHGNHFDITPGHYHLHRGRH